MTKKVFVLIVSMMIIIMFPKFSIAATNYNIDVVNDLNNWLVKEDINSSEIQDRAQKVLGIINVVGVILSVIILMILGIKYMIGSIEEKAEYKKTMFYYILGAIILFIAPTLANIIYNLSVEITTVSV